MRARRVAVWLVGASLAVTSCSSGVRADVADLLSGVPVPSGFDVPSAIWAEDRYQAGAMAVSAVACAWIDQWITAEATGDTDSARAAVAAMATSRHWPILLEMQPQGGWSDVVWEFADAIAGDGTVTGGRVLTVEESYRGSLGCDIGLFGRR